MRVVVRLFAVLRERSGRDSVELELEQGATVADALAALAELPELAQPLSRLSVQMAVNRDYASEQTQLHAGDELALIPPLSGGSEPHVDVGEEPLSLQA